MEINRVVNKLRSAIMLLVLARGGQMNNNRGKILSCFVVPGRSRLKIWSRATGSAVPSLVSLLVIIDAHQAAESGAYSRDSSHSSSS